MRLSRVTFYCSLVIFLLLILFNIWGEPDLIESLKGIDGGAIAFFLLIVAISQAFAHTTRKWHGKPLKSISVGTLFNIVAIVAIYTMIALYYFVKTMVLK